MAQKTARKTFSLPQLIVRVGAGTPVISKDHIHYVAEMDSSPVEAPSHEAPSVRSTSLPSCHETASLKSTVSPSKVPLPASPVHGSPVETTSLHDSRVKWSPVQGSPVQSLPVRSFPVQASSLQAWPGSDAGADSPIDVELVVDADDIARLSILQEPFQRTSSFPELQFLAPPADGGDTSALSPLLPRNPTVTPAEFLATPAVGTKPEQHESDFVELTEKGAEKPRRHEVVDYFSIPTRLVLHPGTPRDASQGNPAPQNPRLLTASLYRSDSVKLSVDTSSRLDSTCGPSDSAPATLAPATLVSDATGAAKLDQSLPIKLQTLPEEVDLATQPVAVKKATTWAEDVLQSIGSEEAISAYGGGYAKIPVENKNHAALPDAKHAEKLEQAGNPFGDPATTTESLPEDAARKDERPVLRKRKLFVRKARNKVLRRSVLKVVLGRELGGWTKDGLETLAQGGEWVKPQATDSDDVEGLEQIKFCGYMKANM